MKTRKYIAPLEFAKLLNEAGALGLTPKRVRGLAYIIRMRDEAFSKMMTKRRKQIKIAQRKYEIKRREKGLIQSGQAAAHALRGDNHAFGG